MNTWIAKTTSSAEIRIARHFNTNIIRYALSPDFEDTNIVIEKAFNGQSIAVDNPTSSIRLQSQHGVFSLTNANQVIRALTGVDIKTGLGVANNDQVALLCKKLPVGMTSVFGQLLPCNQELETADQYCATLKIESQDLALTSEIRAGFRFWENMIGSVESKKLIPTAKKANEKVRLSVKIGASKLRSHELDGLEIGDVLLLDSQFIDQNGLGTLTTDGSTTHYQLFKRDNKACLKIIEKL